MNKINIGIIGLGFMGGSLVKSLKKIPNISQIIAYDLDKESLLKAYADNNITDYTFEINEKFGVCDIIFICTPASTISDISKTLNKYIKKNCIITDIGSIKSNIIKEIQKIDINYIGGHPMVGSERSGYETSREFLFENSYYIITKNEKTSNKNIELLKEIIINIKAIPIIINEAEHDYITSVISHVPHVVAASLVHLVKDLDSKDEIMKTLAAGGFKDITRIASSDATMWENICYENKNNIKNVLDNFIEIIQNFKHQIENREETYSFFYESKNYRDSFISKKINGKTLPILNIEIKDENGAIAKIAGILSDNNIEIRNIEVVNNRENLYGALSITFASYEEREKGYEILTDSEYKVDFIN